MEKQTLPVTSEQVGPQSQPIPVLADGTLTFEIQTADGCRFRSQMDLLQLKLICEECEAAHGLEVRDGQVQPTAAFLADLSRRLIDQCNLERCTPTIAWQIWLSAYSQMEQLKNAFSGMPR
jgi:hypothetical protein